MKPIALFIASAVVATGLSVASAAKADTSAGTGMAVAACIAMAQDIGTLPVALAPDGFGGLAVWLEDIEGGTWFCDADLTGDVFAHVAVTEDLLQGTGIGAIDLTADGRGASARRAAGVCRAALGGGDDVAVLSDGVGDFLVWMLDDARRTYLCNASESGEVYLLERVGLPLYNPGLPMV